MTERRALGLLVTLLVTCVVAGAGCASKPQGRFESLDDDGVTVCAPQDPDGRAVIALSELENVGSADVEVFDIALRNSDGLEVLGAAIITDSIESSRYVGNECDRYGPAPFDAATVTAGSTVLVSVGISTQQAGGRADGLCIRYRETTGRSAEHEVETRIELEVATAGSRCTF